MLTLKDAPRVKKFNYGAFAFGFVWAYFNGLRGWNDLFWPQIRYFSLYKTNFYDATFLKFIKRPVVWGRHGNELVITAKNWPNVETFESTQRKWKIAGIIFHLILSGLVIWSFIDWYTRTH